MTELVQAPRWWFRIIGLLPVWLCLSFGLLTGLKLMPPLPESVVSALVWIALGTGVAGMKFAVDRADDEERVLETKQE